MTNERYKFPHKEDRIDWYIERNRQTVERQKANSVDGEIWDTIMFIGLAFLTGGLFLPFLIYHLGKGSRNVKEIKGQFPYLWDSIGTINAPENLTEEDKKHFYENPMDYKVGENRYEKFLPEVERKDDIGKWGFVPRNPRFKNGDGEDLWWNKPYWDFVKERHESFVEGKTWEYACYRCYLKRQQILFKKGRATQEDVDCAQAMVNEIAPYWEKEQLHILMNPHKRLSRNENDFYDEERVISWYCDAEKSYNNFKITRDPESPFDCYDGKFYGCAESFRTSSLKLMEEKQIDMEFYNKYYKQLTGIDNGGVINERA